MIDINELKRTFDIFKTSNGLHEVEILNMMNSYDNYSGIYDDFELLSRDIQKFDCGNYNIYFRINELKDAVKGKIQYNKFIKGAKGAKDVDIKQRDWLFLDFDPIREGGVKDIAATNEEMEKSHIVAVECYRYLKTFGFPEPIVCKSGNGWHILYKLDKVKEEGEPTKQIFTNFLSYLAMKFTTDEVDVDLKNSNASRLTKLYGTTSRKGANITERPHRKSEIIKIPKEIIPVDWDKVVEISNRYVISKETDPAPQQPQNRNYNSQNNFDLMDFLSKNGIEILKSEKYGTGTRHVLKTCPFHPEHGKDSAIFVSQEGAISFTCFHNGCHGNNWRTLRLKFDPHAYDSQNQYEQRQFQKPAYVPERKRYKIQDENPTLGKKWLSLSSVEKVNLSNVKTIKTGFKELDRKIFGLNLGEVTLLSGSNSAGKTSWLNMLILNVINNGNKVALWSGELPPDKLKMWIYNAAAGKDNLISKQKGDFTIYETKPMVSEKIDDWLDGKLFLYNNEYSSKWEQIFNDIKELLKLDVNLFILDNLFSMDIDIFDGDKNNKQKELILQICQLAKKEQIHIVLVAHPRKAVGFLRKTDISGTADLTNAVDNVFICHRVNNDFIKAGGEFLGVAKIQDYLSYGNCVEVCKNRMFGVVDYLVGMYYEIESRRFLNEPNEHIIYGWEEQYEQGEISYIQPNASFIPQPVQIEEPTQPPLRSNTFSSYIPKEYIEPQIPNDYDDDCPF